MRSNNFSALFILLLTLVLSAYSPTSGFNQTGTFRPVRNSLVPVKQHTTNPDFKFLQTDTSYQIVAAALQTFGYEICIDKKVMIRQLTIPGRPGIKGFKTKKEAERVAALVVKKLSTGMMPPTVTRKELEDLNIHF